MVRGAPYTFPFIVQEHGIVRSYDDKLGVTSVGAIWAGDQVLRLGTLHDLRRWYEATNEGLAGFTSFLISNSLVDQCADTDYLWKHAGR